MSQLTPADNAPLEQRDPATQCPYCGAPLFQAYYFCLVCGTPFKSAASVVPIARPKELTGEELIQRKVPQAWPLVWTYISVILGAGIFYAFTYTVIDPPIIMLLMDAAIFVTTCIFAVMYWPSLKVQLGRIGFTRPEAYLGVAALLPLLGLNYGYHQWIEYLAGGLGDGMDDFISEMSTPMLIVTFCVFPAVCEEVAFRGLLQHWLSTAIKPMHALLVASAIFAGLHFTSISFPILFLAGLLLGWVRMRTGSLYPSILIHFLHNFVVVTIFPSL
jgi:hypothetical protein